MLLSSDLKNHFRVPANIEAQYDRAAPIARFIYLSLSIIFSLFLLARFFELVDVVAANWIVVFILTAASWLLVITSWIFPLTQRVVFRAPFGLLLPFLSLPVVYLNGYMPLAFVPIVVVLLQLVYRGRFRLILPVVFVIAWAVLVSLSSNPGDSVFVLRLLMGSVALIMPIHLLLESDDWLNKDKRRLFHVVIYVGMVFAAILFFHNLLWGDVKTIAIPVLAILVLLVSLQIYQIQSVNHSITSILISLLFLILFWISVGQNGVMPVMLSVAYIIVFFSLLPSFDAVMLSIGLGVASILGIYISPDMTPETLALLLRHLITNILVIFSLFLIFHQREKKWQTQISWPAFSKGLVTAITFTSGIMLLDYPEVMALIDGYWDEGNTRFLISSVLLWVILLWGASNFYQNRSVLSSTIADLQLAENKLKDQLNRQSRMFAVISHEIRTPAASLNMLIHEAKDAKSGDCNARQLLDVSDHLIKVLDDLKYIIKPENPNNDDLDGVNLYDLLKKISYSMSYLFQEKQQQFSFTANEHNIDVLVNTKLIRQIVTNLLKNASIHSAGDKLVMSLNIDVIDPDSVKVRITVEDNGSGIAPEFQQHLFSPFERGETQADGTGLGLYISREYARQLGGDLVYQVAESGGSCFVVSFEALMHQGVKTETSDVRVEMRELSGNTVLLVEDNDMILIMTTSLLEQAGAKVIKAADGEIAWQKFQQNSANISMVLTDIMMPHMDGYALVERLRENGFNRPVIGVTAAVMDDEMQKMLASGANAVIEKPIKIEKLIKVMNADGL